MSNMSRCPQYYSSMELFLHLLTTLTFVMSTLSASDQIQLPVEREVIQKKLSPEIVKTSGDYRISLYFIAKGTRSEGIHGTIHIKEVEVFGESAGQILNTPFGRYRWHGQLKNRKHLWDRTGWIPIDPGSISSSSNMNAAEQGAAANPYPLRS